MSTTLPRRAFLSTIALPAAVAAAGLPIRPASLRAPRSAAELPARAGSPEEVAVDEDYWSRVGQAFALDRSVINLNNGGVSPSPAFVLDAMKRHFDYANFSPPPVALWRIQDPERETARERLARQWKCDPEELALTRNSSESLQICQLGFDLKAGDEVLTSTVDYPRMLTTFKQRERRDGIVLKQFKIPIPCEDESVVVRLFAENITPRTKVILMSHIVNITGQILPVKAVAAMARNRGIPVIVDGAHALAHFDFTFQDLECDYYGVSLHKWLHAPHGTGLLYVRRDKIKGLWPMMAAPPEMEANIRKFEEIGTHPLAMTLAISEAVTFHQTVGGPRKEARLRSLRDMWAKRLLSNPSGRVRLHTSLNPKFSCAIGTFQVEGMETQKLVDWLWDRKHILVTGIKHDEFQGVRVTPSVYTTREEIERFCEAVEEALAKGLPA